MGSVIHPIGAYVQGPDPIRDIINGMVQGVELHNQIQQARDQHEAFQRAEIEQARNNRIQDITQKMLLQGNSREVAPDGTVTEQGQPLTDFTGQSTPVSFTRKADKSRLVTYKDQDGNVMTRELMTRDEQNAQQAREKTALTHAGQVDVSGIMRQMTADQPTMGPEGQISPLPGAGPQNAFPDGLFIDPQHVATFMNDISADRLVPTSADQQALGAPPMARARDLPSFVRSQTMRADNQANNDKKPDKDKVPVRPTKSYLDANNNMVQAYSDGTTKVLGPALKKPEKAAGAGGAGSSLSLTPEALEDAARAVMGGLPLSQAVSGYGTAATKLRTDVFNRASAMARAEGKALSLTDAQSGFKADTGSLTALQKSRDQVLAFENTAGKNLDQFLNTAKKVVDSGSPLINQPLRGLQLKLVGNPDVAAFNTARQVAVTEIAKVLSNPGLSGQLSDSARHEVQGLIGPDATLKQIYSAAGILRSDMKNRAESMDAQIKEVKGRISGANKGSEQQPAQPQVHGRFNPATGKIEAVTQAAQ